MAVREMNANQYQKMNVAERQAKIAELTALRDQPNRAVGFASRGWAATKVVGLMVAGAFIGSKLGTRIGSSIAADGKQIGKVGQFFMDHKKLVGAGALAAAGHFYMANNRGNEVHGKIDIELAKAQAVQAEFEKSLHFQNTITQQDLANRDAANASGQGISGGISQRIAQGRGGLREIGA